MGVTGVVLQAAVILSVLVMSTECGAVFKLQLLSYSNPSGKEMDGDCCDTLIDCGSLPCDHDITFCLDDYRGSPDDHYRNDLSKCSVYRASTGRLDNRLINYFGTGKIGDVTNPIVVRRSSWPGRFVFKIYIRDHDSWKLVNKYSDVDKMFTTLEPPVSRGLTQAKWIKHSIRGVRSDSPTTLDFQMMVYCEDNYYGKKCDKYCYGQDHDSTGHFTCDVNTGEKICLPGWEQPATNCKVRADDCAGNPCERGTCIDGNQDFTCECPAGYEGKRCQTDIDECQHNPCVAANTVQCRNKNGTYLCFCKPGYVGVNCDFHVCDNDEGCLNGGTCVGNGECICPTGYTGNQCETDLCDSITCKNGGKCVRGGCVCPKLYSGEFCESLSDPCRGVRCPNGRCVDGVCLDPCYDKPCLNRATCYIKSDGTDYFCQCLPKYTGKNCESSIVHPDLPTPDALCVAITCHNGGICVSGRCQCPPGFKGSRCETVVDYCEGIQCQNGGTCYSNDKTYVCLCTSEYTGDKCETSKSQQADSCQGVVCYNHGSCLYGICRCPVGFGGSSCETQTGCLPNPCKNGGQCFSNAYSYVCICVQDWTGTHCDQRMGQQVEAKASESQPKDTDKYWIYIVIGVGVALVVFLILIVALLMARSSRMKKRNKTTTRGSFDNPGFRENKIYENVINKRSRSLEYHEQNDINVHISPRDPPPRNYRPPLPERTVSYDGSTVQVSEPEVAPRGSRRSSEPTQDVLEAGAANGYAYAKMDHNNKSKKTRNVKTPKNLEEKFLAMQASVDEEDLKQ